MANVFTIGFKQILSFLLLIILLSSCSSKAKYSKQNSEILSCGPASNLRNLWKGKPAVSKNADSVGALYEEHSGKFYYICSATLIESNIIVTAAHCVLREDTNAPSEKLFFTTTELITKDGIIDYSTNQDNLIKVSASEVHPRFEFVSRGSDAEGKLGSGADIALSKLEEEYEGCDFPKVATTEIKSGNGNIISFGPNGSTMGSKLEIENKFFSIRQLIDADDKPLTTRVYNIDFSAETGTVCPGDSGSPLFFEGKLIGITSKAAIRADKDPNVCGNATAGAFTLVSDYLAWINEATARLK